MDPAISYRVPVTTSTLEGLATREDELGYYDEDFELLKARVAKLESKQSWVEQPPSRLRYFVQVVDAQRDGGTVIARSNLLLLQYRWNMEQQFSGERSDVLVSVDGRFRLRERRVVLDRQVLGKQGLVPDLMLRLVTPPSVLPKLASNVAVCTLNSCTMSGGGT